MVEIHVGHSKRGKKVLVITGDLDKDHKEDKVMVYLTSAGKNSKGARVWLSSLEKKSSRKKKSSKKSSKKKKKSKKSSKKRKK